MTLTGSLGNAASGNWQCSDASKKKKTVPRWPPVAGVWCGRRAQHCSPTPQKAPSFKFGRHSSFSIRLKSIAQHISKKESVYRVRIVNVCSHLVACDRNMFLYLGRARLERCSKHAKPSAHIQHKRARRCGVSDQQSAH